MNNALVQLTSIHFKTFFREPGIVFWAIVFPILISWVLGIAFTSKGESAMRVIVVENAPSVSGMIDKFFPTGSSDFTRTIGKDIASPIQITFQRGTVKQAQLALKKGLINLYITLNTNGITYHYDPNNNEARTSHLIIERSLIPQASLSTLKPVTTQGSRYIDFLIPGLMAFGIMNSCLWGISYNLIEFRMKKLLRRMVATPMQKSSFFISLIIARIILSSLETTFLILFAFFYFKISLTGSITALILVYLSGIAVFSGISILISSRTSNSQVGNGIINAVILPMTILSGVFFNYQNFPVWAIKVIKLLPLTVLVDNLRGIFIEGFSLSMVAIPSFLLICIGMVLFIIGLRIYKWY